MKISSGAFKGRLLAAPKNTATRPTSMRMRETVFNICRPYIAEVKFLDIFAGSGAVGLEALSEGASHASFIEIDKEALKALKKNIETLKVETATRIFANDALKALEMLEKRNEKFDIIFADPMYGVDNLAAKVLQAIDNSSLLAPSGTFFLEESSDWKLPNISLTKLVLKSARTFGSSSLYCFERPPL